jgi:uncharacterized protein YdaU (DUF1376 family)
VSLSWFPLYHGDYLRDTGDLSAAEHGAYLLLLMRFFAQGPLPNDIDRLCRIAAGADAGLVVGIMERYWELVDGKWVNRKMEAVKQQQEVISGRNKERAITAAKARWKEHQKCLEHSTEQCSKQSLQVCQPEPEPNTHTDVCVRRRFAPPSAETVDNFAREKGLQIDAAAFVDFYASKGWRVGNAPMKDWQAAVRNWVRRQQAEGKAGKTGNGTMPRTREQWASWGQQQKTPAKRGESMDAYVARLQAQYEASHP